MRKQLQAKFLMGLSPRELIPLFQLPYSLGVFIIVVRYIHTHPTHTTSTYVYTPNTYHIHVSHTHTAYSHIHIHSVHHTHTHHTIQCNTYHTLHMLHAYTGIHTYTTCPTCHTHTHTTPHKTTQLPPTPSVARYQGTSLCSYTQLLTCGTTHHVIS